MHNYLPHLILILSTWAQTSQAQKHDYMWPLGFSPNKSEYRIYYNFNSDTPNITIRSDTNSTGLYTASYCDKNGQILFFSNGQKIFDKNGVVVENGEDINPTILEWQSQYQYSYPGGQSGFFLEKPENPNIVCLISLDFGLHPANQWPYRFVGQNLMAATIDIAANNGAGKVIEKNKILLSGILMAPAACQHANGRDWWIIVSDADENQHYHLLLNPDGFSQPDTQYIGTKPNPIPYEGGNKSNQIVGNCFSPSGKYYADINDKLGFSIFEFDRCSGLFANERRLDYPTPPFNEPHTYKNSSGTGAIFSPNDSFFYKTTTYTVSSFTAYGTLPYLVQYDITNLSLLSNIDTINIIDSADYHFPTNITWDGFYGAELGPDGRIYLANKSMSYSSVQYPNLRGKACKFIHDKPFFGVVIGSAIPYMPNYRLGPLDGSPCDTLGLNNIPVANFRVDDTLGLLSRYFYDLSHHEPAIWLWNFGDGSNSTDQSPLHQYASEGIYQVCLTVSNQYGSDTYCKTLYLGVSGTKNPTAHSGISLFPNPAANFTRIAFSSPAPQACRAILYDLTGHLILSEAIAEGTNTHSIDLSSCPNGWYIVCITDHGKVVARETLGLARWRE